MDRIARRRQFFVMLPNSELQREWPEEVVFHSEDLLGTPSVLRSCAAVVAAVVAVLLLVWRRVEGLSVQMVSVYHRRH